MHIDPSYPLPRQMFNFHKAQNFFVLSDLCLGKSFQKRDDIFPVLKVSAGKFTHDKGMSEDQAIRQADTKSRQIRPQVSDPNRRIGQNQSGGLQAAPRNRTQEGLCPPELGQAPMILLSDQRLEPEMNQRGFFLDPSE